MSNKTMLRDLAIRGLAVLEADISKRTAELASARRALGLATPTKVRKATTTARKGRGAKLHWTQKPENAARLKRILRRATAARKRSARKSR